jgi:hypothetical protein
LVSFGAQFEEYLAASNPNNTQQSDRSGHLYAPFQMS